MRYTKKIRTEIYKLLATTNCDIAKLCRLTGIDRSTYYKWFNQYEEFQTIIKKSRAEFRSIKRDNVISSLYRRAIGYTVTEVRETIKENAEGEQTRLCALRLYTESGGIEKKIVYHKKYILPSEKAMKYFLENFDEQGYPLQGTQGVELFDDDDDSIDNDDDDVEEEEVKENSDDYNDNYNDADLESLRQEQVDSINAQIESEIESENEIVEEEIKVDIINIEPVVKLESKKIPFHKNEQELLDSNAKFRKAVAIVIAESSPQIQKQVKEETDTLPEVREDFLVGLPCDYAMRIASRIYEDKKIEYRKKHNIPLNDYQVKPYPVTFNEDAGQRRANVLYRERMHDIPIIEEAKALKKYIIAAQMEKYYEDLLVMNKCYYSTIWD